jgi:phosphoglycolate phosphatase
LNPALPRALLLDLDGTLVDSRRDIAVSCNAALAAHGIAPLEPARILTMVGDGARALVTRALAAAGSGADVERVLASFREHYEAHPCVHTVVCDGARELLACGLPCAVLTNKPREVTLRLLDALALSPLVAAVWAGEGPLKPAPDGVLALCKQLGVLPAETWVVGDGPQDVGAGRAAGAFTVAVINDESIGDRAAVLAAGPDRVVGSLREVVALATSSRPL